MHLPALTKTELKKHYKKLSIISPKLTLSISL